MNRIRGTLVLPEGLVPGEIAFDDRIREILREGEAGSSRSPSGADDGTEFAEGAPPYPGTPLILPGFIDVHVHGGGGGDAMDGPEGVRTMTAFHGRHGTTTIFPTTITNPFERVLEALRGIREVMGERETDGAPPRADIAGAHLEGPFISPDRLGAQPPYAVRATPERVDAVLEPDVVRLVTLAPEIDGASVAASRFATAGTRVSVGHTRATYEGVAELLERVASAGGTAGFTHLYNAMGGLEGRVPGIVGAALASGKAWAELILDLHHVHPASARAAWAAKGEKLLLVTDAIRAAGLPEGETELGGQPVTVSGGAARLADGTLAGSVLTLDAAVRNSVAIGMSLDRASWAASGAPAAYMGLRDRGTLTEGLRADLVLLDAELSVQAVYVAGREVE